MKLSSLYPVVLALLVIPAVACKRVPAEQPGESGRVVTIAVISGLRGALGECACTGDRPARLARLAARVEALRAEGPVAVVVVGDTFFPSGDSSALAFAAESRRATTIAAIIAKLEPVAVLSGPGDFGPHREQVRRLAADHRLPIFSQPRTDVPHRFRLDSTVQHVGGLAVGLLGAPGDPSGHALGYGAGAIALRAQGASVVVGLLGDYRPATDEMLKKTTALNVAIASGGAGPVEPRMFGPILVVDAGSDGDHLGLLRLRSRPGQSPTPRDWVYDNQRRSFPSAEDPVLSVSRPPPTKPAVTWNVVKIDERQEPAPWAADLVAECGRLLRTANECPPSTGQPAKGESEP